MLENSWKLCLFLGEPGMKKIGEYKEKEKLLSNKKDNKDPQANQFSL